VSITFARSSTRSSDAAPPTRSRVGRPHVCVRGSRVSEPRRRRSPVAWALAAAWTASAAEVETIAAAVAASRRWMRCRRVARCTDLVVPSAEMSSGSVAVHCDRTIHIVEMSLVSIVMTPLCRLYIDRIQRAPLQLAQTDVDVRYPVRNDANDPRRATLYAGRWDYRVTDGSYRNAPATFGVPAECVRQVPRVLTVRTSR
jgi:hypothetical protein